MHRTVRAIRAAGLLMGGALAFAAGCASDDAGAVESGAAPAPSRYTATWTPGTSVRFVTIDRRVTVVPVDSPDDLLILQERDPARGPGATWIIVAPVRSEGVHPVGGDDGEAWVVTDTYAGGRMARRAKGSVELRSAPDGALEGLAWLDPVEPGSGVEPLAFSGRFDRWDRRWTIPTPHLESRSGVSVPTKDPNKKDPEKTDSVWPWHDLVTPAPPPGETVGR